MSVDVPEWLDELLRCPRCRMPLARHERVVRCERGHEYPLTDGYADLWIEPEDEEARRTAESFGYEWTTFDANNEEDAAFWARHSTGLDLSGHESVTALDAGCGKGRYTRFIAAQVGRMVALDGSIAVRAAVRNLAPLGNTAVVRADLRAAPFDPASFGFVSSIGVLHHLDDPRAGFDRLAALVAPGGTMFVYLYSRPEGGGIRARGLAAAAALRRASVRVPHRPLRWLSIPVAAALWLTLVLPGAIGDRLRVRSLAGLPMHTYRGKPFRSLWLDTFDRLSAPIEHRYVWSQLQPWFDDAGLVVRDVRDDAGFYVVAGRPAASSAS